MNYIGIGLNNDYILFWNKHHVWKLNIKTNKLDRLSVGYCENHEPINSV